jgi:iron complex transport system substrate-binding protein
MKTCLSYTFLGIFLVLALWTRHTREAPPPATPLNPVRIVSLAPGITETLYALGLGDRVAGVTQFCAYPPEAREKPRVAGFTDVNYEAVLRLRPDLVILPRDRERNKKELENLGLPVLALDTRSLSGLTEAVELLGKATGHEEEARAVLAELDAGLAEARARAAGRPEPGVLFSVMHSYQGLGYITEIHAVGKDGFYSELVKAAGGRNSYAGDLPFPRLSREAVLLLNPEVIIDVIPAAEDVETVRRDWQSLSSVSAIKNNRLYFLTDEADTVPGPRSSQTLTRLSRALHPQPAPGTTE